MSPPTIEGSSMREHDITDPRVVPRWVESGVSGVPRNREWDMSALVAVPELDGARAFEFEFAAFADGAVRIEGDVRLPPEAVERLGREVERALAPPYTARAVRHGRREWFLAARALRATLLALPPGVPAESLEVVLSPEGERVALVDGEIVAPFVDRPVEEALRELERRGRERFQAFVARADKLDEERWQLTVDAL